MKAASRAGRRPSSFATLSPYDDDCLTVIIETAKGSPNKCAYTPRLGDFVLTGVLPAGAVCPDDLTASTKRLRAATRLITTLSNADGRATRWSTPDQRNRGGLP